VSFYPDTPPDHNGTFPDQGQEYSIQDTKVRNLVKIYESTHSNIVNNNTGTWKLFRYLIV